MFSQTLIVAFTSLMASTVVASQMAQPQMLPRTESPDCTAAAEALVTNGVEPSGDLDAALGVFLQTAAPSDYCDPATVLAESLQSTYSAYKSGVLSYFSVHTSEIASVESACPDAEYATSLVWLHSIFDGSHCTFNGTSALPTGAATTTASSTVAPVTAGAALARETGMIAGSLALAGFMGAVAAL
ncbi:hypothetical protein UCRPA7_3492 [Phaeoacremonium minimum UCRPA7]|uniref:Infection structure specific protein n=1 Tax=Phaeoacremonium minimum (strain UCR-PA7) TaxID=1286976 RepID=R8BNU8_PHAM7|nr:hypothetical protein UCRPA7_3492 [Phaeoacremonium minimum UCRPA7]EOO01022.1 hypothetical protein UCRPA7_3492 [Phaeoacremonium minimum UCRPA7]